MAAPTSGTTDHAAYVAPGWAVKNRAIFLSCQKGAPPPTRRMQQEIDASRLPMTRSSEPIQSARSMAVVAAKRDHRIPPPTEPPCADYFRDVANHPDVLSTIISTARDYVGFPPPFCPNDMTHEQAKLYIDRFNEFISELNQYYAYIDLTAANTQPVENNSTDCSATLDAIVTVLATAMRVPTSGADYEELKQSASALIKVAVDEVIIKEGTTTRAGFEMLGLPASNVEDETPAKNPSSAVTFTPTTLFRNCSDKTTVEESFIPISYYTYTLKSSAIVEYAEYLAGTEIIGTEEFVDSINKNFPDSLHEI